MRQKTDSDEHASCVVSIIVEGVKKIKPDNKHEPQIQSAVAFVDELLIKGFDMTYPTHTITCLTRVAQWHGFKKKSSIISIRDGLVRSMLR